MEIKVDYHYTKWFTRKMTISDEQFEKFKRVVLEESYDFDEAYEYFLENIYDLDDVIQFHEGSDESNFDSFKISSEEVLIIYNKILDTFPCPLCIESKRSSFKFCCDCGSKIE